jgi:molecular chaperone DnaK
VTVFAQKFQESAGISSDDLFADRQTWQELTNEAEKCKMALSSCMSYKSKITAGPHSVTIEVTRADFEQITRQRLNRTIEETKILFERGRAQNLSIETILLVGGSTFMPQVEARLQ